MTRETLNELRRIEAGLRREGFRGHVYMLPSGAAIIFATTTSAAHGTVHNVGTTAAREPHRRRTRGPRHRDVAEDTAGERDGQTADTANNMEHATPGHHRRNTKACARNGVPTPAHVQDQPSARARGRSGSGNSGGPREDLPDSDGRRAAGAVCRALSIPSGTAGSENRTSMNPGSLAVRCELPRLPRARGGEPRPWAPRSRSQSNCPADGERIGNRTPAERGYTASEAVAEANSCTGAPAARLCEREWLTGRGSR